MPNFVHVLVPGHVDRNFELVQERNGTRSDKSGIVITQPCLHVLTTLCNLIPHCIYNSRHNNFFETFLQSKRLKLKQTIFNTPSILRY